MNKLDKRLIKQYSTDNLKIYAIPQTQVIREIGVQFTGGRHIIQREDKIFCNYLLTTK